MQHHSQESPLQLRDPTLPAPIDGVETLAVFDSIVPTDTGVAALDRPPHDLKAALAVEQCFSTLTAALKAEYRASQTDTISRSAAVSRCERHLVDRFQPWFHPEPAIAGHPYDPIHADHLWERCCVGGAGGLPDSIDRYSRAPRGVVKTVLALFYSKAIEQGLCTIDSQ